MSKETTFLLKFSGGSKNGIEMKIRKDSFPDKIKIKQTKEIYKVIKRYKTVNYDVVELKLEE